MLSMCSPESLVPASVSHPYKGRLDGGSLRATHWTTVRSHLENATGFFHQTQQELPHRSMGSWPQLTSPLPRPGQLQVAPTPGMGTGSGHTQGLSRPRAVQGSGRPEFKSKLHSCVLLAVPSDPVKKEVRSLVPFLF